MTIIYITENKTKCYAVTSQNKGWIKVQKIRDVGDDKNFIYEVNPMQIFIGKSQLCNMTNFQERRIEKYLMEIQFYLK